MKMSRWYSVAAIALLAFPASLTAQGPSDDPAGPVASPFSVAFASAASVPTPASLTAEGETNALAPPQLRNRSGRTYMIAGAAALIGGLLIEGDVGTLIAAGGVVMGVYGILLYY